jgi:hypothetical protein
MRKKGKRIILGLLTVCTMELMLACAQGDRIKVEGLITERTGDTIHLRTIDGSSMTITLDDDTKVKWNGQRENICCRTRCGPQGVG